MNGGLGINRGEKKILSKEVSSASEEENEDVIKGEAERLSEANPSLDNASQSWRSWDQKYQVWLGKWGKQKRKE